MRIDKANYDKSSQDIEDMTRSEKDQTKVGKDFKRQREKQRHCNDKYDKMMRDDETRYEMAEDEI